MLQEKVEKFLEIIVCPKCKQDLKYNLEKKLLTCDEYKMGFKIKDGIPILLESEAVKLDITE